MASNLSFIIVIFYMVQPVIFMVSHIFSFVSSMSSLPCFSNNFKMFLWRFYSGRIMVVGVFGDSSGTHKTGRTYCCLSIIINNSPWKFRGKIENSLSLFEWHQQADFWVIVLWLLSMWDTGFSMVLPLVLFLGIFICRLRYYRREALSVVLCKDP